MIVTIDGPAASGKSSTARTVAEKLGFRHLESGALYRGLTYAALRAGIAPESWDNIDAHRLAALDVRAEPGPQGFRILARGHDVTDRIRSEDVNRLVSRIARIPAVRDWLLERLRTAARDTNLVADGRDMGTVVFPDADIKFFLTASLEARARRRALELSKDPDDSRVAVEKKRLAERDRTDTQRAVAPLRPAADAIHIDTTALTFEEQVDQIVSLVNEARSL
jgi:cytidylate kinase